MSTLTAPRWGSRCAVYGVGESLDEWNRIVESREGVVDEEMENELRSRMAAAPDAIDQAAGLTKALEAEASEIKAEESRLRLRRQSVETQAETLRLAIGVVMDRSDMKSAKGRFTVSRTAGRKSVEIVDASQVPDTYLVPQPPQIDRKAIADAMKSGIEVPGVEWTTGDAGVTIR